MTDLSGTSIKGYELRECLGEGSYGAVYRAFQPQVGREVAIKIILPEYANQPDFILRFDGYLHCDRGRAELCDGVVLLRITSRRITGGSTNR